MSINHSFIFSARVLVLCLLPEVQRHGLWSCPRDIKYLSTCPFRTFIFDIYLRHFKLHESFLNFYCKSFEKQIVDCFSTLNFQWQFFSCQMLVRQVHIVLVIFWYTIICLDMSCLFSFSSWAVHYRPLECQIFANSSSRLSRGGARKDAPGSKSLDNLGICFIIILYKRVEQRCKIGEFFHLLTCQNTKAFPPFQVT